MKWATPPLEAWFLAHHIGTLYPQPGLAHPLWGALILTSNPQAKSWRATRGVVWGAFIAPRIAPPYCSAVGALIYLQQVPLLHQVKFGHELEQSNKDRYRGTISTPNMEQ